jgi:hypothetical protein
MATSKAEKSRRQAGQWDFLDFTRSRSRWAMPGQRLPWRCQGHSQHRKKRGAEGLCCVSQRRCPLCCDATVELSPSLSPRKPKLPSEDLCNSSSPFPRARSNKAGGFVSRPLWGPSCLGGRSAGVQGLPAPSSQLDARGDRREEEHCGKHA